MIRTGARSDRHDLYIFVSSDRPDPYINVLAHVLSKYPDTKVHYVAIREHSYHTEQSDSLLTSITAKIHTRLEKLRDNFAISNSSWSDIYEQCLDHLNTAGVDHITIPWRDLDKKLGEFAASEKALFDVTSLKKNLLVDVVSLLLSRGCTQVHNFELIKQPTFGDADLIHQLKPGVDYVYRNLGESSHVEASKKRIVAHTLTLRTLAAATGGVTILVLLVQVFFGSTWLQTMVTTVGTATSIAGFLFLFLRNAK